MILKPTKFRLPIKGHWGTKQLVGCWLFNDTPPLVGKTLDVGGNRNNGTLAGDTYVVAGKFGPALSFDGIDDSVNITSGQVVGSGAATICAWIYPESWGLNGSGRLVDNGKVLFYISAINSTFRFSSDGGINTTVSASSAISFNTWYFLCVTRNSLGIANLYRNGILSGTADQTSGIPANGTTNLYIGNRSAADRPFDGTIDNVMIWNRVLTPSEIVHLYTEPFCMFDRERIELWSAAMAAGPAPPLTSSVFGSLLINGYSKRKLHKVGMFAQI